MGRSTRSIGIDRPIDWIENLSPPSRFDTPLDWRAGLSLHACRLTLELEHNTRTHESVLLLGKPTSSPRFAGQIEKANRNNMRSAHGRPWWCAACKCTTAKAKTRGLLLLARGQNKPEKAGRTHESRTPGARLGSIGVRGGGGWTDEGASKAKKASDRSIGIALRRFTCFLVVNSVLSRFICSRSLSYKAATRQQQQQQPGAPAFGGKCALLLLLLLSPLNGNGPADHPFIQSFNHSLIHSVIHSMEAFSHPPSAAVGGCSPSR